MTWSDLVQKVSEQFPHLEQRVIETCVRSLFSEISSTLSKGGRVELRGFGVFEVRKRKARTGSNPRTGDSVSVPEKSVPFFKAGKLLRDKLNKS